MLMRRLAAALGLVACACTAAAAKGPCGEDPAVICAADSPWYQATGLQLRYSDRAIGDSGRWSLAIQDLSNLEIEAETRHEGKRNTGKVLLVSGRVMLTKGLTLEKGYEVDVLNEPVLYYQLIASLLGQVFSSGPNIFKDTMTIAVDESKRGIRIATSSATGYFAPPWSVLGAMHRTDREAVIFSLMLDFPMDKARRVLTFEGTWKKAARPPRLNAGMSLNGWNARALGGAPIRQEGSTILDYGGARPVALRTLGELRAALRRHSSGEQKKSGEKG